MLCESHTLSEAEGYLF